MILFVTMLSCQSSQPESDNSVADEELIVVSRAQFQEAGMEIGVPQPYRFSKNIQANGYLQPAPGGEVQINVVYPGRVKNLKVVQGEFVPKGSLLFELEGTELIDLQMQYVKSIAEFELAKKEFERLQKLANENIISEKELQRAQSTYRLTEAEYKALEKKLQLIHIDPENVVDGKIVSAVPVRAPIGGTVSSIHVVVGQFLESTQTALVLVDPKQLQLKLNVFEAGVQQLKPGQRVTFYTPGQEEQQFEASLSFIGQSIDSDSKSITCVASLVDQPGFRPFSGSYVEAIIHTGEHDAMVVPSGAVISGDEGKFLLLSDHEEGEQLFFRKVKVETGYENIDLTEILTPNLRDVLLKGVYNLSAEE